MHEQDADKKHEAILALLDEAMAIMRDGKSFNPESPIFGPIVSTDKGPENTGCVYRYKNGAIPPSKLGVTTEADPLNYSEDRTSVSVVPSRFFMSFYGPVRGFTWTEIQKRLDLADYWIDSDGKKEEGNCFPASPPNKWVTICRYRAHARADSRFPVDVQLGFFGPRNDGTYDLDQLTIDRAYPYLTPEMRKQKREEQEQRAHALYRNPGATK